MICFEMKESTSFVRDRLDIMSSLADIQKHPSSLAVLAEDLRKLAEIHQS